MPGTAPRSGPPGDRPDAPDPRPDEFRWNPETPIARWFVGVVIIVYGFSKINGMQFAMLESELDRPLREVSGFWLTWHYFGFSTPYKLLIAGAEIGGGLLLLAPRTAVLGALVLLPVLLNIIALNAFYGVAVLPVSILLAVGLTRILWPHRARLRAAILPDRGPSPGGRGAAVGGRWTLPTVIRGLAIVAVLTGAAWFQTLMVKNTRAETPVSGAWDVDEVTAASLEAWLGETIYLEVNRAHMAVLPAAAGSDRPGHYLLAEDGTVRIHRHWLDPESPLLLEGTLAEEGVLLLRPADAPEDESILLRARR